MSPRDDPAAIWSHDGRTRLGYGGSAHDPGTGAERYEMAARLLKSSGGQLAFASFTFDPEEGGSVVVIPEEVVSTSDAAIPSQPEQQPRLKLVSDGVDEWRRGMERIQEALSEGLVEKAVLARQVELDVEPDPHPPTVAERLRVEGKSSYTFLVDGLVGCSPELLVSLQDKRLTSLALAGTAPDQNGLRSDKARREHKLAVESVRAVLRRHVRSLDEGPEQVMTFGAIHHLGTRLGGSAVTGTAVTRVLADLHPTAGVAGTPTSAALEMIRAVEPRGRGRYAGPVGWFDADGNGEFAIALRCGVLEGSRVTLYAGGGIVPGSDPEEELAETELKLGPMLSALGRG